MRYAIYRYLLLFFCSFLVYATFRTFLFILYPFSTYELLAVSGKEKRAACEKKKKKKTSKTLKFFPKRKKKNTHTFSFDDQPRRSCCLSFNVMRVRIEIKPNRIVHVALPQTHNDGDQPIQYFLYFILIFMCAWFSFSSKHSVFSFLSLDFICFTHFYDLFRFQLVGQY